MTKFLKFHQMQWTVIILLFITFIPISGKTLLSVTPCAYPMPSNIFECGVGNAEIMEYVKLCDPDQTVSMSEVAAVKEAIERINARHKNVCICRYQHNSCWYSFGFAFLQEIIPIDSSISDAYHDEPCESNMTTMPYVLDKSQVASFSRNFIQKYGENYVRILRDRWAFAGCDEDVLFLIVQNRPPQLMKRNPLETSIRSTMAAPYIFAAFRPNSASRFSNMNNTFRELIDDENYNLESGYSLKAVIERLLQKFEQRLSEMRKFDEYHILDSHVPNWAIGVFLVCALLCLLMATGLCLVQSSARRTSSRGKVINTTRRWKSGFVGENMEGSTTAGVNLMQMMIPPSSSRCTSY